MRCTSRRAPRRRARSRHRDLTHAALLASLVALTPTRAQGAEPAGAEGSVITLDERVPALMVVMTPREFASSTPTSEFLEAARRVLRARTRLALASAEQAGVDAGAFARCGAAERLGCWLLAARPDALAAEAPARSPRERPRYLFVLSVLPSEEPGEDRLSAFFLDADRGVASWRSLSRGRDDGRDRVENALFEAATQTAPEAVRASDRRVLQDYLAALVERELRPTLERAGDWEPYGVIVVEASAAGLPIAIDGLEIGVTARGATTELRDVTPGRRTITVGRAGAAATLVVDVERGGRAIAAFDALLTRMDLSDRSPVLRYSVLAGGAALGVAGVAIAILGAARGGDVRSGCVLREGDGAASCVGLGAPTFGWDPSGAPAIDRSAINPAGVTVVPLGLALGTAGATLAGGTLLLDDDARGDRWLWLPVVVSVGAGLLVYGTGAALGGP
ncbi:hypothetical protein L6R52_43360 [Myxococcota bacterium]|nr:hypothetical protein [Myxococcota bacterium]